MAIDDCFIPILLCSIGVVIIGSIAAIIITNLLINIVQKIRKRKVHITITKDELRKAFNSEAEFHIFIFNTLLDRIEKESHK